MRHARDWVIHPVLLAAYPVLFLFEQNTADQLTFDPLWLPLLAAVGGALVLLALASAAFRNVHQGGIAASVLVIGFFSFGHLWNLIGGAIGGQGILLAVYAVAIGAGLILAWHLGRRAQSATGPLNLLAMVPLLLTLVSLGQFAINRGAAAAVLDPADGGVEETTDARPDIYWLVFDRYAGSPTMERHYDFDNEPFLGALEERGFYVARNSVANYPKTGLSLTSTLEMAYLDQDALEADARSPADQGPINRRFQGRLEVPSTLAELGYQFILVPSWWTPTASNVDADVTLRYDGASEFSIALLETTLYGALTAPTEAVDPFSRGEMRNYTLHQLEQMPDIIATRGAKFVLAHFLIPHPPYLFDRDGEPFTGAAADLSAKEQYVRQTEYTNAQILRMVDAIQSQPSEEPPVIIVQADEGPFPLRYERNGETFQWADATADELEIKFRILNAISIPGADPGALGLHPSITPVNTYRIVFNALFGADLPLLPERVYAHTDYRHFYEFIDVGDRIPGWP